MSARGDRKKRLGSRRMPNNHEVDKMSVDQQQIPEESGQSLTVSSADVSKSEIQLPPAHEVSMNRRKLGSSRKSKGRQLVKGPETELPYEAQENVEQETKNFSSETQMSAAVQLEKQDELNWGIEHDTSAPPDPTTTSRPEDVMEGLRPKVDQMEACSNDTKLEETETSDSHESREVTENTQDLSHELTSVSLLSCPSPDQKIIISQAANYNVCSLVESESPIKDDTDLSGQDGSLQGNYWVDESRVKSVVLETVTTEKATNESSLEEKNEIELCAEQAAVFFPKEEFPTNEHNDLLKLSEVTDPQHSEHVERKEHEKNDRTTSVQAQVDVSSQSVTNDKEHPKICSENQEPEIISSDQSEAVVESTDPAAEKEAATMDEKQNKGPTREGDLEVLEQKNEDGHAYDSERTGITNIERSVGQMCEDADLVETGAKCIHEESVQVVEEVASEVKRSNFSPQTQRSDLDTLLGPQPQDSPVSMDEQTNADFSLTGNRRKLGSSRKIKGRHTVKKTEEEILEKSGEDEALEITKLPLASETACQEELNQDHESDILSMSHESPLFPISAAGFSEVQVSMPTKYPEADLEIVIFKGENSPQDQDERERENNLQVVDKSAEVSVREDDKSESRQSKEVESAHVLEDAVREQQEDEVHSTQMQNNLQTDHTCETVEAKDNCHVTFGNQIDQKEIINSDLPDFTVSNTNDSAAKQEVSIMDDKTDVYLTKENTSEALGSRNADYDFYDTNKPHLDDIGNADASPSQVHDFMGRVEDDLKPDADHIFHLEKEGLLTEMEENNCALSTFHSKSAVSFLAQPQEKSLSFDEEHSMDFPHSGNRMELGTSHENKGKHKVKDMVIETCYKEADNNAVSNELSETTTETSGQERSIEIMDGRQKNAILQTEEANTHTGTLVTTSELTIIGGHSASGIDHEAADKSGYREMPDEELPNVSLTTGTEKREKDERTELLMQDENYQQSHLVCELHTCPIIPEMLTEKSSSNEHTQPAWSDEKASPVDELATKEEQLSNVRVTRHLGDAVGKAHEQEIEPEQMQDMSETDDATENAELLSRNLNDQAESGHSHHLNVTVTNVNDAQPQISDTEPADAAVGDAHETKDQDKYDLSLSAEDAAHQVREGLFSEMGDTETISQSLQNDLDSQPQQNETDFNSCSNNGTLGSHREKCKEVKVEEMGKTEPVFIENTTVHCEQNAQFAPVAGITEFPMSSSHSSPTAGLQLNESYSRELPEDRTPTVSTVIENKEKDGDMEMLKSCGNSQGHEPSSENKENTTERTSEKYHTEFAYSAEQRFSSPQEKILETAEQVELFKSSEAAKAEDSENVGSEAHEEQIVPEQNQEMHQTDHTSVTESNCDLAILQSHTEVALDSKPLDNLLSTKDETQSTFKTAGNRRKMGSSRRKKGTQQHVEGPEASHEPKEGVLKIREHDEATEKLATRQKELKDVSVEKVEMIIPTGSEDEAAVKLQDVNTFNPHYVVDNSTFATSNINLDKEDSLKSIPGDNEDTELVREPEKLSQFTGYDTDKKDMMQSSQVSDQKVDSDTQNVSYHDDIISTTDQVPDQDEVFQCQNIDILSCNKELRGQELRLQPRDNVIGTVGSFTTEEHSVEVESSIDVKRFEQDDVGEKREVNTSYESVAQEPAVDESTTMDARTSGEEKARSDYSENVQENTKMKKRKLGSTRRTLQKRKEEGETDHKDNTKGENVQILQDTVERRGTDEAGTVLHEESELQNNTSDQQSRKFNAIIPVLLEESSSEIEAAVNPAAFDEVADKQSDKTNADHCVETLEPDGFARTEMQKTAVVTEEISGSLSQLVPSNTETSTTIAPESSASFCESSRDDEDGAVTVKVAEVQATNQQKPGKMNEGGHNEDLEIKGESPDLNVSHRRKKMASTRRSLGSRAKGENLHQKQEPSTAGEDATTASSSGFEEQLQLQTEHKDVYARQQNEKEEVEAVHADESKESPVSHQLTPSYYPAPSTSPKSDALSESASGARKKKLGSSRKSRMQQASKEQTQNDRLIDSQNERDVSGITEEGAYQVAEEQRGESPCLDKILEVDESNDKTSPNISVSKVKELSKPQGEKTPFRSQRAEISLVQERQQQFSFADKPRGAELGSNSYNVVMLGDSSVGKTSFMKRAQSGKFSLDIPASVGLDSCIWNVVVDGKSVQLQLWDTAGQERFRSITRQILHKGQAFLLMYDITSPESFSSVSFWANHIQENASENVTVLLLGNKSDHAPRQVGTEEGENLAKEYNFEFMECSAATGENVVKALETVARMLSQKADSREEATLLLKKPAQEKRSRCC